MMIMYGMLKVIFLVWTTAGTLAAISNDKTGQL